MKAAADAGTSVMWTPGILAGDLSSQLAVEQEIAREGLDRSALGRDEFVARARTAEIDSRATTTELLASLGVHADLDAGALDTDDVVGAARTAFVRLYEAGLLTRSERVVMTCPRCATVVDDVDIEDGVAPADKYRLRFVVDREGELLVDVVAPELLPGVVAVVVPAGHPADGASVEVPIAAQSVPVVGDTEAEMPRVVIPGHAAADLDLARRAGLAPITVLDGEGTVVVPGPLAGLGRYAARAAAADLLAAEGAVESVEPVEEPVSRCRRCGTVVVPRLGDHWFLPMADLEVLAADAVRQGVVTVTPAAAGDELVTATGDREDWCLSHQVWAGQPVPVGRCRDCGQLTVSVEPVDSCGRCMGTVVPDDDVLDARFVGAVWPLALAGWPRQEAGPAETAPTTVLLVAPTGLLVWAVRMAALGLRLAGAAPFTRVAVHPGVDPMLYIEPASDLGDTDVDRYSGLVAGGMDLEWAAELGATLAPATLAD